MRQINCEFLLLNAYDKLRLLRRSAQQRTSDPYLLRMR